jgi:hypothetical protein
MTCKQSLYARTAALVFTFATAFAPGTEAQEPRPPCGACIVLGVSAERVSDVTLTLDSPAALVVSMRDVPSLPAIAWRRVRTAVLTLGDVDAAAGLDQLDLSARKMLAEARGREPALRLGLLGPLPVLDALLSRDLAAYVDFVVVEGTARVPDAWKEAHPGLGVWRAAPFRSFDVLLEDTRRVAQGGRLLAWPAPAPASEVLEDISRLASFFPELLVELPAGGARCDPEQICRVTSYQRADTQETIVRIERRAPGRALIALTGTRAELAAIATTVGAAPGLVDSVLPLAPVVGDASNAIRVFLPVTGVTSLLIRIAAAGDRVAEDLQVVAARDLTVAEIVARHQAQAARQRSIVRTLITEAETTLTFEVPAFPAPVTIQADTLILQGDGPTELVQRDVRVNGASFSDGGIPRLPIIEPERAAAPPLAITLTREYEYRLEGRDAAGPSAAYVVSFEPKGSAASLFRGRAWIDASSFALVRVDAVQTNLRGSITASQQIDEFSPQAAAGGTVWLLSRSETRQIYQGAGVTTPVHRILVVRCHRINPPDFADRRRAAHASRDIMLRETLEGLRYLRHDDEPNAAGRVTAGRATRIAALAGGVIVDPNITRPLPFAGLNYTDFDLAATGAQFNAFFGGAYGQAALTAPSIGGSRWHLVGSGFVMLARYNDRAFRDGRERYEENLRQRPFQARAGVLRPLTPRTSARVEYAFDLTLLEAADTTSPDFAVPANQVVHALRLALETQRAGWRIEAWWNPARRTGWRPWGLPGTANRDAPRSAFQRMGVSAGRPWVLGPRVLSRLELAAMGGTNLDRFSRFAFGTFENRLRGYPSASIRYDRGAVARGAIVWQPGRPIRVDGFADLALVREPGAGPAYRGYPGLGAAAEAPGPFSLLLGIEWGYGLKGLNSDGTRGTHVVRISAYKVF